MTKINKQINIQVSSKCNFACSYCFVEKEDAMMSLDLIPGLLDFLKRLPQQNYVLHFTGGEPLLNFEFIKNVVATVKQSGLDSMSYFITTNGSLLTDEIINFLSKERIGLEISFDGTEKDHLLNRKAQNNDNYYERLIKTVKKLEEKKIYFKFNLVVALNTVENLFVNYLEALKLVKDINKIRISPVEKIKWPENKIQVFYEQVFKVLSYLADRNCNKKDIEKIFIDDLLIKPEKEVQLTIKHNGNVYSDLWFKNRIGDLEEIGFLKIKESFPADRKHVWQLDEKLFKYFDNFLAYYPEPNFYSFMINTFCNNECLHCVHKKNMFKPVNMPIMKIESLLDKAAAKNKGIIGITGGEPTLHPKLAEVVDLINSKGMSAIVLTNAKMFYYKDFADKFKSKKVLYDIPIHHSQAEEHDQVTRTKGSFAYTVEGIKNLIKNDSRIIGKTVITKRNYDDILNIVKLFKEIGVRVINLTYPTIAPEHIQADVYNLVSQYKDIKPYLLEAVEYAEKNGMILFFNTIPFCILPEINKYKEEYRYNNIDTHNYQQIESCSQCVYVPICKGPGKHYVNFWGADEFKPVKVDNADIKKTVFNNYLNMLSQIILKL